MDMIDNADVSPCGLVCSVCEKSGNVDLNSKFIKYIGGLMAAFFSSTLKNMTKFESILKDDSKHPFATKLLKFK